MMQMKTRLQRFSKNERSCADNPPDVAGVPDREDILALGIKLGGGVGLGGTGGDNGRNGGSSCGEPFLVTFCEGITAWNNPLPIGCIGVGRAAGEDTDAVNVPIPFACCCGTDDPCISFPNKSKSRDTRSPGGGARASGSGDGGAGQRP